MYERSVRAQLQDNLRATAKRDSHRRWNTAPPGYRGIVVGKIIGTGSRDWSNWAAILLVLSRFPEGTVLVHGDCRGERFESADRIIHHIGRALGFEVIPMPANWKKYGRAAGPIRNSAMLAEHPDATTVVAFPLATSVGTIDMMRKAVATGRIIVEPPEPCWHDPELYESVSPS